jgi:hypothetical protein
MPTITSGDPNMPTTVISERIARSPLGRQTVTERPVLRDVHHHIPQAAARA